MKPESMCKRQFFSELRAIADDLYSHGDSFEPSDIWKQKSSYLDGFVSAGILFEVAVMNEVQDVIDALHLETFGEDREARKLRCSSSQQADLDEAIDWDKYDSPAFTRESLTSK